MVGNRETLKLFHIFGAPILFSPTAEVADPPKTNILTNEK